MGVTAVIEAVEKFSQETFCKPCNVVSVKKNDNNEWLSLVEIVVEDEEMRRYARTPIVGMWEVHLDNRCHVMSFERKGLKEATALEYETEK